MIEDTSKRDPNLHLLGMWDGDTTRYITDMESAGQRQLVASQQIPFEGSDELEKFGFKLGEKTDDLFRSAELPQGWSKRGSDHAMWSYVDDDLGRERVAIFYKAAYYDRRAFCRVVSIRSYLYSVGDGNVPLLLDDEWATAAVVRVEAETLAAQEDKEGAKWDERITGAGTDAKDYIEWRDQHLARAKKLRDLIAQIGA